MSCCSVLPALQSSLLMLTALRKGTPLSGAAEPPAQMAREPMCLAAECRSPIGADKVAVMAVCG